MGQSSEFYEKFFSKSVRVSLIEVDADSLEQLKKELLSNSGPVDQFGKRRYAVTKWTINWNWPLDDRSKPLLDQTAVLSDIEVRLPSWVSANHSSDIISEYAKWQLIYESLLEHELDHVRQALATKSKLAKKFKQLSGNSEVSADQLNKIATAMIRENNQWDLDYDLKTLHGKNQGVH